MPVTTGDMLAKCQELLDTIKGGAIAAIEATFAAKLTDYQAQVAAVAKPSIDLVKGMMSQKLFIDPNNGDDNNSGLGADVAFKTLQALIDATPDGANVEVVLVGTTEITPLVLAETTEIKNRHIVLLADVNAQYINLATPVVFGVNNGSVVVLDTLLKFRVLGDVVVMHSVWGKATLSIGGYGGANFTLDEGAVLSFLSQHYDFPAAVADVVLHRVRCLKADGSASDQVVNLVRTEGGSQAVAGLFRMWQCSMGSGFTENAPVNALSDGVKLVSIGW